MNNTLTTKIEETLDRLKAELSKIDNFQSNPCNKNLQLIFQKVYAGTAQLEGLHHVSSKHTIEIIDLHSKYVNKSFEIFGNYHGWIPE
jgi:hypothetical protein